MYIFLYKHTYTAVGCDCICVYAAVGGDRRWPALALGLWLGRCAWPRRFSASSPAAGKLAALDMFCACDCVRV